MTARRARLAAVAVVVALVVAYAGVRTHRAEADTDPLGPDSVTVTMTIHHSRFTPDRLAVRKGTIVHFVIRNTDPIGHEFIIGDDGVHRRHESGTEPVHPPRPGEVSVAAGASNETTFRFDGSTGSGDVVYACHLPGHLRYGMSGVVDVVP